MILPGLLPPLPRTRPFLRSGKTYNNARVNSTTIQFPKSDLMIYPGDMFVVMSYVEVSSSTAGDLASNFGLTFVGTTGIGSPHAYKVWDGTEPDTLQITRALSSISFACLSIYVFSGISRFVGVLSDDSSSRSVLQVSSPARVWAVRGGFTGYTTDPSTPPPGYTGYQNASTTTGDNGMVRTAYRIADEGSQLGGSWTNPLSQSSRVSMAFR